MDHSKNLEENGTEDSRLRGPHRDADPVRPADHPDPEICPEQPGASAAETEEGPEQTQEQLSEEQLACVLEGLLLICGEEGLNLLQMQSVLPYFSRSALLQTLQTLRESYEAPGRGLELLHVAGRWKLTAKAAAAPYARKLFETIVSPGLSQAALEVLAIIAYRQPITRVEIEEIRGVGSDAILKKLLARDLIEAKDRLDVAGRPLLYTVTEQFLDTFGLESLQELPAIEKKTQDSLFESVQEG